MIIPLPENRDLEDPEKIERALALGEFIKKGILLYQCSVSMAAHETILQKHWLCILCGNTDGSDGRTTRKTIRDDLVDISTFQAIGVVVLYLCTTRIFILSSASPFPKGLSESQTYFLCAETSQVAFPQSIQRPLLLCHSSILWSL